MAARVARREGIRVIGHAPRNLGLAAMFEERQYALAHAEEFLYDTTTSSGNFQQIEPQIPDLARSMVKAGIWLMPNLTAFKMIGLQARNLDAVDHTEHEVGNFLIDAATCLQAFGSQTEDLDEQCAHQYRVLRHATQVGGQRVLHLLLPFVGGIDRIARCVQERTFNSGRRKPF